MKRFTACVLSLVMLLSIAICQPATANAASIEDYCKNRTYMYDPDYGYVKDTIYVDGISKASQIKNLTSSKSALKVRATEYGVEFYSTKFTGTAKINFKVGSKKLSTKVTIKKYVNPLSSIKIGDDDYTDDFKNRRTVYADTTYSKKKLTLKAKSGWIISDVSTSNGNTSKYYDVSKKSFSKAITLTKEYASLYISLYNDELELYQTICLELI